MHPEALRLALEKQTNKKKSGNYLVVSRKSSNFAPDLVRTGSEKQSHRAARLTEKLKIVLVTKCTQL